MTQPQRMTGLMVMKEFIHKLHRHPTGQFPVVTTRHNSSWCHTSPYDTDDSNSLSEAKKKNIREIQLIIWKSAIDDRIECEDYLLNRLTHHPIVLDTDEDLVRLICDLKHYLKGGFPYSKLRREFNDMLNRFIIDNSLNRDKDLFASLPKDPS
jgi:hypothetical protein